MTTRRDTSPFSIFTPFFAFFGEIAALLFASLGFALRGAISYRSAVRQMAEIGVGSLFVALVTVGFSGGVAALYVSVQLVQLGQQSFVGGLVGKSLALEVAPVIAAVVVAARAGSAMAAELGSMVVTEQVDALRSLATSPVRYLVVPRVLATLIMLPLVTVLANGAGALGGYAASVANGVAPAAYWSSYQNFVEPGDQFQGLFKSCVFALLLSVISCRQGLNTRGGAAGVGRATTSAVVLSMTAIFVVDFFLSLLLQDISRIF